VTRMELTGGRESEEKEEHRNAEVAESASKKQLEKIYLKTRNLKEGEAI